MCIILLKELNRPIVLQPISIKVTKYRRIDVYDVVMIRIMS